jgi:CO/xanthine dehydrogenase FAD-binding subunit
MVNEYFRPESTEMAVKLLTRKNPVTYPLGGGTFLSHLSGEFDLVDLSHLGLDHIVHKKNLLQIGATVKLQELIDFSFLPQGLVEIIKREVSYNLRQMATMAGAIVTSGENSLLKTALIALDSVLVCQPGNRSIQINQLEQSNCLITSIEFDPRKTLKYEVVSKTPADIPIMAVVVGKSETGNSKVVISGLSPEIIVLFDGIPDPERVENAINIACSHCSNSESVYKKTITKLLTNRLLFIDL